MQGWEGEGIGVISDPMRSKRGQRVSVGLMFVEPGCIFGAQFLSVPVIASPLKLNAMADKNNRLALSILSTRTEM